MKRSRTLAEYLRWTLTATVPLALVGLVGLRVWKTRGRDLPGPLQEIARKAYRHLKTLENSSASAAELAPERADEPMVIFADALGAGWSDWSWATHSLKSPQPTNSGSFAIAMTPEAFKGVYFHHDSFETGGYGSVELSVYSATERKTALKLAVAYGGDNAFGKPVPLPSLKAGWNKFTVSLASLEAANRQISGICVQDARGERQDELFLDDIRLLPDLSVPPAPTAATITVRIDPDAGRHPISPLIYGVAHLPEKEVAAWHLGSHRWGGNPNSRHNWTLNTWNAARDWQFRNYGKKPGEFGPGGVADAFVAANKAAGVATVMTVPTLGWVAKDADKENRSQKVPGAGGPSLNGDPNGAIAGYDPSANRTQTSVRSVAREKDAGPGDVAQDAWVRHLVATYGTAAHGGVPIFAMDNEPDLWANTHTDVHPAEMGYDDILANFLDYATAIKDVDPTAQITGPVSWGWTGYFYSALDRGKDNFRTHADRTAHGDTPFLPWFLSKVRQHDTASGRRSLDILDVHYYPQGGLYSARADTGTRERRLRSTRSLWDPTYKDESWIGEPVQLIPRLKEWIGTNYPGTKIGITEWNFGGEADISGALAIAEVLGIYGREGIYLANYWTYPKKETPAARAFQLMRNADGAGHGFGDVSCAATSSNPDRLSTFAAVDSKTGARTILLINKMRKATVTVPVTVAKQNRESPTTLYRLTATDTTIRTESGPRIKNGSMTVSLPPYSAVLVRFDRGTTP